MENLKKHVTLIWSCDSGQRIPCFDNCQLIIISMSIIKLTTGYRFPHWLECLTFYIVFPVVWSDGRTYGHVITKISRMERLPNFLRYGAQLASASRARGAPVSRNFFHFLKSDPTLLDDEFEDSFVHLYSVPCTD